jgi:hypothetical protein
MPETKYFQMPSRASGLCEDGHSHDSHGGSWPAARALASAAPRDTLKQQDAHASVGPAPSLSATSAMSKWIVGTNSGHVQHVPQHMQKVTDKSSNETQNNLFGSSRLSYAQDAAVKISSDQRPEDAHVDLGINRADSVYRNSVPDACEDKYGISHDGLAMVPRWDMTLSSTESSPADATLRPPSTEARPASCELVPASTSPPPPDLARNAGNRHASPGIRDANKTGAPPLASTADMIIELNVGGRIFATTKETLSKHPGSLLHKIVTRETACPCDSAGRLFLDKDPNTFDLILEYLRDGYMPNVSAHIDLWRVAKEADAYGIHSLSAKLMTSINPGKANEAAATPPPDQRPARSHLSASHNHTSSALADLNHVSDVKLCGLGIELDEEALRSGRGGAVRSTAQQVKDLRAGDRIVSIDGISLQHPSETQEFVDHLMLGVQGSAAVLQVQSSGATGASNTHTVVLSRTAEGNSISARPASPVPEKRAAAAGQAVEAYSSAGARDERLQTAAGEERLGEDQKEGSQPASSAARHSSPPVHQMEPWVQYKIPASKNGEYILAATHGKGSASRTHRHQPDHSPSLGPTPLMPPPIFPLAQTHITASNKAHDGGSSRHEQNGHSEYNHEKQDSYNHASSSARHSSNASTLPAPSSDSSVLSGPMGRSPSVAATNHALFHAYSNGDVKTMKLAEPPAMQPSMLAANYQPPPAQLSANSRGWQGLSPEPREPGSRWDGVLNAEAEALSSLLSLFYLRCSPTEIGKVPLIVQVRRCIKHHLRFFTRKCLNMMLCQVVAGK